MPSESDQQNFLARRVINRRPRYYNLTVPQIGAIASALVIGVALWWVLGVLPLFAAPSLILFALRLLGPGAVAGALAVLFYALADDLREPILRQSLYFVIARVLLRHTYRKETADAYPPRRAGRRHSDPGDPGDARGSGAVPRRSPRDGGVVVARVRAVFTAGTVAARAALSAHGIAHRLPGRRSRD